MSLHYQEGVVDPVKIWVNARLLSDNQQVEHPWADMFIGVCYPTNMSLHCQEGVVDPVKTWVNTRLQLYGRQDGERKCKHEATVIGNVEGLSVVVLVT